MRCSLLEVPALRVAVGKMPPIVGNFVACEPYVRFDPGICETE